MARISLRFLPQAVKLWRRHRLQALLSTLGIVTGIAGLVLVIALGEGARQELEAALGGLGSGTVMIKRKPDTGAGEVLTVGHQETIAELLGPHLRHLAPMVIRTTDVVGDRPLKDIKVIATDRHYQPLYRLALHQGRFLADHDQRRAARVCVLGWELGKSLFPRGQVIGSQVRIDGDWYLVVGWLQPGAAGMSRLQPLGLSATDRDILVPLAALAGNSPRLALDELTLGFHHDTELAPALALVRRIIEGNRSASGVEYLVPVEVLRQKQKLQQLFQYVLLGVATLMLIVGGVGIMNVMMVNVIARRQEIGLRLAVGATREDILLQFVTESLVVALLGGVLGVTGGFVLAAVIDLATELPMAFSLEAALIGCATAVAIGVIFGSYPALQAASVSPVQTLNQL